MNTQITKLQHELMRLMKTKFELLMNFYGKRRKLTRVSRTFLKALELRRRDRLLFIHDFKKRHLVTDMDENKVRQKRRWLNFYQFII